MGMLSKPSCAYRNLHIHHAHHCDYGGASPVCQDMGLFPCHPE